MQGPITRTLESAALSASVALENRNGCGGHDQGLSCLNGRSSSRAQSTRSVRRAEFLGAAFPVMVFVPVRAMASTGRCCVQYLWVLAFGGLLARLPSTRQRNTDPP